MNLFIEEFGDKQAPMMLFLHGGGLAGWMWEEQIDYFSHYHCVVVDLPGHGKSAHLPFSIKSCAKQLIELIETYAPGKETVLVGLSLGAQIGLEVLSSRPDLVQAAMINSANVRPSPTLKRWIRPAIHITSPLVKNKYFSKLQAKALYIREKHFERYYEESCKMKAGTLANMIEESVTYQLPSSFKDVESHVLIAIGGKEKAVIAKSAQQILKSNKHCIGIEVPGVGHGLSLAKPALFNEMVDCFLAGSALPKGCVPL